jgi:Flp pilus assembly protein CpaB
VVRVSQHLVIYTAIIAVVSLFKYAIDDHDKWRRLIVMIGIIGIIGLAALWLVSASGRRGYTIRSAATSPCTGNDQICVIPPSLQVGGRSFSEVPQEPPALPWPAAAVRSAITTNHAGVNAAMILAGLSAVPV